MSFKVGEEVLCVKGAVNQFQIKSVANKEYIVRNVKKCGCGWVAIDIGGVLDSRFKGSYCFKCRKHISNNRIMWQAVIRFVRKSSATQADEMLNVITETIELVES